MSTSNSEAGAAIETFVLDPHLAADSVLITNLALSQLRLMNDQRFPWLILIPRRADMRELIDLLPPDRQTLYQELEQISRVLLADPATSKLNIGALGNIVPQLHIHVLARHPGDAAWPGPAWGQGTAQPYAELDKTVQAYQAAVSAGDRP